MNGSDARQSPGVLGLRTEVVNDVLGIVIILTGIFLFLSLATHTVDGNLMGVLGEKIYDWLTFLFGIYAAYVPVIVILLWGISFWRGRRWHHVPARVAGGFAAVVCFCALLAIPYANVDFATQPGFRVGGALGNFLVHRECLNFRNLLGVGGCYLVFSSFLLGSLLIAGDVHFRALLTLVWQWVCTPKFLRWPNLLAVWGMSRPDPAIADADEENPLDSDDDDEPLTRVEDDSPTKISALQRLGMIWGRQTRKLDKESEPISAPETEDRDKAVLVRDSDAHPHELAQEQGALSSKTIEEDGSKREKGNVFTATDELSADALASDDLLGPSAREDESSLPLFDQPYQPPPLSIFQEPPRLSNPVSEQEMQELASILEKTLSDFGIAVRVVNIEQGPTVSRIEAEPAPGVKISRITGLEADLARAMRAESVRIVAPIPGRGTVGFEIPNKRRVPVYLRHVIESPHFRDHESPLAIALGATTTGEPFVGDLASMPHLLIAGTTGSGKSVCLNSIICSILFRMPPDVVKFIMIDPKRVELNVYRDIPHLLAPVVSDVRGAAAALKWAVAEMEMRFRKLAALAVRNISAYNSIVRSEEPHPKAAGRNLEYMPHIVIVIDELADLILAARNEVEDSIVRLAQMSRAVGMHLIIATQRPSVNVITGIIKANFPCRIAFKVSQKVDSRTILDCNGAETLLGKGDMLFAPTGSQRPIRLQGCYASDSEVESLANYLRSQQAPHYWKESFIDEEEEGVEEDGGKGSDERSNGDETEPDGDGSRPRSSASGSRSCEESDPIDDDLLREAVRIVLTHRLASTSLLQRKLRVGFARAGRLMDEMEERGIVGPSLGPKPRDILVDPEEYLQKLDNGEILL